MFLMQWYESVYSKKNRTDLNIFTTTVSFQVFDRDNDGFLTASELRDVMMHLGDEMTIEDITEMVREADTNGDGKIDYSG